MSGDTRPDLPAVLSAVAIRSYMRNSGWRESTQGTVGSVWTKGDAKFCVPHEGDDPDLIRRALVRLASAEGRTPEATAAAVAAYRDAGAATKDCGCGPLEPCGPHLGRGSVAAPALPAPVDSGRDLPGGPEKPQPRAATVTDQDVTAALLADVQFRKASRSLVWTSPSSEAVRAMLEAVAPRLVAAERARIRQMAIERGAVYCRRGVCTCIRLGSSPTIASFAGLIGTGEEAGRG